MLSMAVIIAAIDRRRLLMRYNHPEVVAIVPA